MKNFCLCLSLLLLLCGQSLGAERGALVFCETFDDQWRPVNEGTQFTGMTVSWIATLQKKIGIPQLTVTVYRHDGAKEMLHERKVIDVNPEWNTFGMRYMSLPRAGDFTIALTTPSGEALGQGRVILLEGKTAAIAQEEETLGATLEALFQRYSSKQEK